MSMPDAAQLYLDALALLQGLVRLPSLSKKEDATANLLIATMQMWGLAPQRTGNNVWAWAPGYDATRPALLLCSHHDTVSPAAGYTRDPYDGAIADGRLYGLGANDAGASLVALLATFRYFCTNELPVNVLFVAAAEEEISGAGGISMLLPAITNPHLAIVGEPTAMHAAVAERGLLVLDCTARGRAGHAARNEGDNAIYKALSDVEWLRTYQFPKISDTLGPVHMSVTTIAAGSQHNVVPDTCTFTVDLRLTDSYTHEEALAIIRTHVQAEVVPRSMRLRASATPIDHPVYIAAQLLGLELFGSPTLSDQALLPFHSIKIGPGDSARSHTADEYIYLAELEAAIPLYIRLIQQTYPI